jgi:3-methyl-2-oxobutanoate hydroxymethyltransferase
MRMALPEDKPWTVPALAEAKREGRRLAMLTAYDAVFARVFDRNGVDLILVGDSLGMVVKGHDSTLPVTVDEREIPVAGHLGLTPQSVLRFGGFKVQGREERAAAKLREDAQAVADAGASLLVLECVPSALAQTVTAASPIPTIGIGAGPHCDGQVLVLHDFLGLDGGHRRPKFVKDFLEQGGSVAGAVQAYCAAVRDGRFPDAEHAYQ